MVKNSLLRAFALLAAVGSAPLLAGCFDGEAREEAVAPPPPQVAVAEMHPHPVPLSYRYAGRVSAFREVEVRARVSGILLERAYIEGARVKAGDVLFRIDPAPYEAEVARAEAQLQEAEAQLSRARRDAERAVTLYERKVGTLKARDDAISAVEQAEADVAAARAQLRAARIDLDYTTVTAPIDGITSLKVLPEGSLVGTGAGDSLLTRISQLDPVYVNFSFSGTEYAEIRRLLESGQAEGPEDGRLTARISFGDGQVYEREGYIDFTDSSIDLQTGTIRARAVVPNPEHRLLPGQFVRVTVTGVTLKDAIVVPQAAVMQGPQGQFVYTVDASNKAGIKPVTLGREVEGGWIVADGLRARDRVVTEGVIKVRPGNPVAVAEAQETTAASAAR